MNDRSSAGRSLCWIRRDLRLNDSRALAEASRSGGEAALVFVFDSRILDALEDRDDRRVGFIVRSLHALDQSLRARGSRLLTLIGDPADLLPRLAAEWGAERVFAAHDDDPYALERDRAVAERLSAQGSRLVTVKDHVVFERLEVSRQGLPFRVYTPYMKAWRGRAAPDDLAPCEPDLSSLAPEELLPARHRGVRTWEEIGFTEGDGIPEAGEEAAQRLLASFLARIDRYAEDRDFPSLPGVSGLSIHLRFGTISIRQCFREAMAREGDGPFKWAGELIWREFYHMILSCFPHVAGSPFLTELAGMDWPGSDEHFEAWKEGRTGFPLVDAAMRELRRTGRMHNRLRMVTACFLTKDLLVDWRKGEAWFARWLLDFDLASNNGGWQWSASTGVDAQPWFRVFNPLLQSRKFDPQGDFIRQGCPELAGFDNQNIHWPSEAGLMTPPAFELGRTYPAPIIDHRVQRDRAQALFRSFLKGS